MNSSSPLADGFPQFTEADWRAAVDRVRKGNANSGPPPLFQVRSDVGPVAGRAVGQPWSVVERIDAGVPSAIGAAMTGGATGLEVVFAGTTHPLGSKLNPGSAAKLAETLPSAAFARVDDGGSPAVAEAFVKAAPKRGFHLALVHDPIAALANGKSNTPRSLRALAANFGGVVATADGRPWHGGGATDEHELGVVLATFVAHLRELDTADQIGVTLVADAEQFRTIAKFRAVRLLLARLSEVTGGKISPSVHAETAWRTMSVRTPDINILRATSAAFGAAVGGADSITVLPHDALNDTAPAAFRLARNTQLVLAEEANVFRVTDPAAGSGAIETMTERLAEGAWGQFQAIEAEGGIEGAIASGRLLGEIAEARDRRLASIADGSLSMIGVEPERAARPRTETGRLVFVRLAEALEGSAR